ncbi:MAG: flagellar M-ring protein FliF C-terminal domain-containing protein [Pirellula sp.]
MNQLNQLLQQMRALCVGMTPQSRVMTVLLAAGVAVSSVFLVQGFADGNGSMTYLFDGKLFSDAELVKMEIAFSNAALRKYERNGNRIRIPRSSKDAYYKAISEGKAVPEGMGKAIEAAVNNGSFLEPRHTTEAKHQAGLLKDIANNIMQMEAIVVDASVNYVKEREGFSAEAKKSASIAIKTRGGKPLTTQQKLGIITYVAHALGLKQSEIALLDLSDSTTMIMSNDPSSIKQAKYYEVKRQREEELRGRAERLLMDYGNVRIDVNVDIDPTLSEETDILTYNDKPSAIQARTLKRDTTNRRFEKGGRSGTEPNATAIVNKGTSLNSNPEQSSKSNEQTENDRRLAGNTLVRSEKAGLQTTRVSFSVAVPFSFYKKVSTYQWLSLNPTKLASDAPPLTEQDLAKIKLETAASIQDKLIPIMPKGATGEDKLSRVNVTDYPDMPTPEIPPTPLVRTAMAWLSQYWQTIALMGLVGAAILSLRQFAMTASSSKDSEFEKGFDLTLDDASDIDLSSLIDDENESVVHSLEDDPDMPRLRTTGGDVKNDMTALIRENPDAAATLLRNWIGGTT